MMVLPVGVIFLFAFINNTLFIQVDPSIGETFICLSINNANNDTWPSTWRRMNINNGLYTYKINEDIIDTSSIIQYKLRLHHFNKSYVVTEKWNELYRASYEKECNVCIILFNVFLILFIGMLGYIIFNVYLYFK